jgi:hypothetical protein
MKLSRLLGVACVLGIMVTACSSSNVPTGVTAGAADQTQGGMRDAIGPNGLPPRISTLRGWTSLDDQQKLVYVSCTQDGEIAIDLVDGTYIGKITDGIKWPEGLATDKKGNLYVANRHGNTITVYPPGATSPSLTLTESDKPDDVAVGSNGYVYAGDADGGIDVYSPGGTSPIRRLTNSGLANTVSGVGVDASNDVYATGYGQSGPAVVEFASGSGSGTNLGLTGLKNPAGVIIDKNNNLVVSDHKRHEILIYPPGQTSPSGTIRTGSPVRSALNKAENLIFVPQTDEYVNVYDYPSGKYVLNYSAGGATLGVAVFP